MDDKNTFLNTLHLPPAERMKETTKYATDVEIDANIPPKRYYRSGVEMVRMADVYLDEKNYEKAYILYLKFITLFIEKMPIHPDFGTVSGQDKATNIKMLRQAFPKAENLKKSLLQFYHKEYEKYLIEKSMALAEEERLREDRERDRQRKRTTSSSREDLDLSILASGYSSITPVPPLKDDELAYPDIGGSYLPSPSSKAEPPRIINSEVKKPGFDRSTKPTFASEELRLGLRIVSIPDNLTQQFLSIARPNTSRNIETCAILAGKLRNDELVISHLIIPEQSGSSDSCTTQREEDIFDYQDLHNLITIGWIHTHPSQTAFLSSVDLHTHYSYQKMMPEAIAIVCAPRYNECKSFCLTIEGLFLIGDCQKTGFHPHPADPPLFTESSHSRSVSRPVEIVDLRR